MNEATKETIAQVLDPAGVSLEDEVRRLREDLAALRRHVLALTHRVEQLEVREE